METPSNTEMPPFWRPTSTLPSFSRAFDIFTTTDDVDDAAEGIEDRFFVPSYLQGSTYVQKLEEEHKARVQAHKESKRAKGNGHDIKNPTLSQAPLPPGSHRGMSHTVLERPPPAEEHSNLASLPARWNKDDIWTALEIRQDGLTVKYSGPKNPHERDHEASAVRAEHYMPPQCGIYYYEVHILSGKRDEYVLSSFVRPKPSPLRPPRNFHSFP